jgi:hypothetical protein
MRLNARVHRASRGADWRRRLFHVTAFCAYTSDGSPRMLGPGGALAVTVSQSGPDSNPHGPDLQKRRMCDSAEVLANDISAGQAMIMMCPRPDCTK